MDIRRRSIWGIFFFLMACQSEQRTCSNGEAYRAPFQSSKLDVDASELAMEGRGNVVYDLECIRESHSILSLLIPEEVLNSNLKLYSQEETGLRLEEQVEDKCVVGMSDSKIFSVGAIDPEIKNQDHLKSLKVSELDKVLSDAKNPGREVVVAVIDTGVDLKHEDLSANKWVNTKEIPGNNKDDDGNGYIDDVNGYNFASKKSDSGPEGTFSGVDHATHVAGLIAAVEGNDKGGRGIRGKRIKIMSLNVFGKSQGASIANIENAIRYAADNGAHIMNMSLGGPGRAASTESALIYAINKGSAIVVAAGNDGAELTDSFFQSPASYGEKYKGMITVGSSDSKTGKISSFSNRSTRFVEVLAPGSEDSAKRTGLLSTFINNKYGRMQGTSMASPVVAGALAVLKAFLPLDRVTSLKIEDEFMKARRFETDKKSVVAGGGVLDLGSIAKVISQFVNVKEEVPVEEPVETPVPKPTEPGNEIQTGSPQPQTCS